MKKFLTLLLTLSMATVLCACDNTRPSHDSESKAPSSETEIDSVSGTQSTEEIVNFNLDVGSTNGAIYSNESLGVAFSIPGGWEYATEEKILELNNISSGTLTDALAEVQPGDILYLQAAYNYTAGNTIAIQVILPDNSLTEKEWAEYIYQNTNIEESLIQTGFSDVHCEVSTITIGGEEHYGVRTTAFGIYSYYYSDTIFINRDDIVLCISLGLGDENIREDILNRFHFGETAKEQAENNYIELIPALGYLSGSTYINESFGFSCELSSEWTFKDRDYLLMYSGLPFGITDDQITAALSIKSYYIAMHAKSPDGSSLKIEVERIGEHSKNYFDEATYVKSTIPSQESYHQFLGYENVVITSEKKEFLGKTHFGFLVSATTNGQPYYKRILCVQIEQHLLIFTVVSVEQDDTLTILNNFNTIKK